MLDEDCKDKVNYYCYEICMDIADENNDGWLHKTAFGFNASYPLDNYCNLYCS